MPEIPDSNSTSGAESSASEAREPSLREIAEAAYDSASSPDDAAAADDGQPRDERGRFASRDRTQDTPGEAEAEPPSPDEPEDPETSAQPDPAPEGSSNQPLEHWSAEDRATFQKLPGDAQAFFMRRYQEMEADYTRKSQANATAVQAINALTPIFNDPLMAQSLREMQLHPVQAISDWARLHRGALSANPQEKASILIEIAERMGFDPARLFAKQSQPQPSLPPEVANDPAARFLADKFGSTASDMQALRAEIQELKAHENQKLEQEALRSTRWSIDTFADEKGADGRPLRPYFDRVLPIVIEMFRINPERDLGEAYETACWSDPNVRQELLRGESLRLQHQHSNQRAAQAARSNVRGLTSPVSKPAPETKGNGSLRDALEASADEVGF